MHRVFVYGSLKRGYHNNAVLSESQFIGERFTEDKTWVMRSLSSFPGVLRCDRPSSAAAISGELYEVDDRTLKRLDRLESNGQFYQRELVHLRGEDSPAWMYVLMNDYPFGSDCQPVSANEATFYQW